MAAKRKARTRKGGTPGAFTKRLHGGDGAKLSIRGGQRKAGWSVAVYHTAEDGTRTKGMHTSHDTYELALAHANKLVEQALGRGWTRHPSSNWSDFEELPKA